jgi:hypothetical protein
MELPKKVKIAGIDVKVVDWDHHEADAQRAYGIFSKVENCIKIDTTLSSLRVTETFIHELLHGIWAGYRMDEKDDEERTVAIFAAGLTQVFRDTPELLVLLQKVIKEADLSDTHLK